MTERMIPSTEFQSRAGQYMDAAGKRPVFITKYDRPVRVLMDIEEYERLKAMDDRIACHPADLPDDLKQALTDELARMDHIEAADLTVIRPE